MFGIDPSSNGSGTRGQGNDRNMLCCFLSLEMRGPVEGCVWRKRGFGERGRGENDNTKRGEEAERVSTCACRCLVCLLACRFWNEDKQTQRHLHITALSTLTVSPPPISTFGALHRPAINTCWIKWKTRSLHREDAVFSPGSLNRPQKCPRQDDSETTPFLHIK